MINNMIKLFTVIFLVLLVTSCVEDKGCYDYGGTNSISDGKERMELNMVVPVGNMVTTRGVENGLIGENRIDRLFIDIMNGETIVESCSTEDGKLTLSPSITDSIYVASATFDIGTLAAGYTVRVRANEDSPQFITEQPAAPFYMSGIGQVEKGTGRNFTVSVHLLRGVAKLRMAVRKTSLSVPQQELEIGDVKVQVIHAVDKIRKYAPFRSHISDEYIYESLPSSYFGYFDYPQISLTDIPLKDEVEIEDEMVAFYSQYIYENFLGLSIDYKLDKNVTRLKVTIPVTDGVTSRVIERIISVHTHNSYVIRRNYICSIDVQVLSLDEVKIFTDMLDWEDVGVTGDIVGGADFDIDRTKITLIKDIADPVKLVKVDCHTPGRLRIRALKSDKTALMSTTDLQLYCNGITETDKLADNSGIYDLAAAQVMNFYCTTGSVPANYEGGFIEISSDNVHVEYIPVSSLDTFTPLDTEGTANSYIADKGAGSYSFTATIMGNGVDGIIDEGKFEDASGNILTKARGANIGPVSAKLLWQDTDELVEQVALVNGRVQVKMGRSRGNAVIAVYDNADPNAENAKVLWSWHLWCTAIPKIIEYTPSRYTGNEYKVMDRNLGATTATPDLGTTQGLRYQWGRKDPFSGSLTYDGVRTILYDVRSGTFDVECTNTEAVTIAKSINTPNILRARANDGESWCETSDMKCFWGNPEGNRDNFPGSTIKTIYDPCPVGYKVSPADVLQVLCKSNPSSGSNDDIERRFYIKKRDENGTTFYCDNAGVDDTKLIYLPETYYPSWAGGDLHKFGNYWSSSLEGEKYGYMFTFDWLGSYILPNNIAFATTGSIRCVKE